MAHTDADTMNEYLKIWTLPSAKERREAIESVWAAEGSLIVSSTGESHTGWDAIADHIHAVHEDLIAGKGLRFSYDQSARSGEMLLLRWSMTAPNDAVVGRGVDIVQFTETGRISAVHMFMGIN